jgi:serine/threonine protein kinase
LKALKPGDIVDGYRIVKEAHRGGMARLYEVCIAFPDEHTGTGFDQRPGEGNLLMKVPRMSPRDSSETIVSFEVESMILPMLKGKHMPTLRGKGSLQKVPYLLMEQLSGQTLLQWLLEAQRSERKATVDELVGFGIAMAVALFSLHRQRCCHHDLKPANVFLHRGGHVVLLDFGLARHAHLPDLHAEEMRQPVGSPAVLAPEQIVGIRGDIRSDIYALGVLLYVMATLRFPFGMPTGRAALKSRIWSSPCPIRKLRPDLPSWFQEIVFRCLLPLAADRYQSAAHLVFDLRHPTNIKIGALGGCIDSPPWRSTIQRLFRYLREGYQPSEHRGKDVPHPPIVLLAINHADDSEPVRRQLGAAAKRAMGGLVGARLALVTVVRPDAFSLSEDHLSQTEVQRRHLNMLHLLASQLGVDSPFTSCHVLEGSSVATTLVRYAESNHVNTIVLGIGNPGHQVQRWANSIAVRVAMLAPCTVTLVKLEESVING